MSPKRLTVDDVKHHVQEVRDLAVNQAKELSQTQASKALVVGAVAVVAAISLAYYLGSRSGSTRAAR